MTIYTLNQRNCANGLGLINSFADESAAAAFFDPQYRGVLDKLNYGYEGIERGCVNFEYSFE